MAATIHGDIIGLVIVIILYSLKLNLPRKKFLTYAHKSTGEWTMFAE